MATDIAPSPQSPPVEHNARSAWFMLLAAAGYSIIPLAVMLSESSETPFLFGASWRGGIAIGYTVFLAVAFPKLFFNTAVWKLIGRNLLNPYILLVMVAYFDVVLFAMSIRHLDVAVATMMMEISPLFYLLLLWFSHRDASGAKTTATTARVRPSTVFFMLLSLTGITFIILSQKESEGFLTGSASSLLYLGLLLAVVSAVISTLNSFSLRWGANLSASLSEDQAAATGYSMESVNIFSATAGGLIASVAVVPIQAIIGLSVGRACPPTCCCR